MNGLSFACKPVLRGRVAGAAAALASALVALCLLVLGVLSHPQAARAANCTISWANPVNGLWQETGKWDQNRLPNLNDTVCITVAGTFTVTVDTTAFADNFTISSNGGTKTLVILNSVLSVTHDSLNAGAIVLDAASGQAATATLSISNGSLLNQGTLTGKAGIGQMRSLVALGLTNQGVITTDGNTSISAPASAGILITNTGTLNVSSGQTLTVTISGATVNQNAGAINNQGTLLFNSAGGATFYNHNAGTMTGNMPQITNATVSFAPSIPSAANYSLNQCTLATDIPANATVQALGIGFTTTADRMNSGIINLDSTGAVTSIIRSGNGTTFTNAGVINTLTGSGGGREIQMGRLVNQGTLNFNTDALVSAGNGFGINITNTGTLSVAGAKTLTLNVGGTTYNQNGGLISNLGSLLISSAGGVSQLNHNGGTMAGNPPQLINITLSYAGAPAYASNYLATGTNSLLTNLPANATLALQGNAAQGLATLTLATSLSNFGMITLDLTSAAGTRLNAGGGVTFTNVGILAASAGVTGPRSVEVPTVVNQGTINANSNLNINAGNGFGAALANTGNLNVAAGATLDLTGSGATFTQTAGATQLSASSSLLNLPAGSGLGLQGGTLLGAGVANGNVNNSSGTVSPGLSPGILTINGAYTQGSAGHLSIEIGGLSVGTQYDRLVVSGTATLDGVLNVTLINGFQPGVGDAFEVLDYGSHSGAFSTITGVLLPNARIFTPAYGASNLILNVANAFRTQLPVVRR